MRPEDFFGRDGEVSAPKLRAFIRHVLAETHRVIGGAREHRTRLGRIVVMEADSPVFAGAFFVSVAGLTDLTLSTGRVNGVQPTIGGVYLDGTLPGGGDSPDGVPRLDCGEGPGERSRSWVGLRVALNAATLAIDPEDPEAVTVAHRTELPARFSEGGAPDEGGTGFWPVAELVWNATGRRIVRVRQIGWFDKTHRYVDGEPGRHFFESAA